MPVPKPHKGEEQSAFMERCMHEVSQNSDRTNEQNVAICLGAWRDAHPGSAPPPRQLKQAGDDLDVPEPDDDESQNDFMDRCVDQLLSDNDDLEEDDAIDACQMA